MPGSGLGRPPGTTNAASMVIIAELSSMTGSFLLGIQEGRAEGPLRVDQPDALIHDLK